jgi:hypothetical protein
MTSLLRPAAHWHADDVPTTGRQVLIGVPWNVDWNTPKLVSIPNHRDDHGLMFKFEIAPSRKEVLLKGLDDIGTTMQHEPDITAYEKTHPATMYDTVDVKYYSNRR